MKHTFTHKILPALAGTALALALAIGFAPQIRAQVGTLFGTGGGNYGAQRFQLAAKNGDKVSYNGVTDYSPSMPLFGNSNQNAIFRMAGSALFDNVMSFGQTRLEKLVVGFQLLGANAFNPLSGYALDVNGSIAVRKFSNDQGQKHYLCADDFGKLVISDQEDCGSAPAVDGQCGTTHYNCTAGTSTNNVENSDNYTWTCEGSNGGTDATCSEEKKIDGKCEKTHYRCIAGTSTNNVENRSNYTWTCKGENGGSDDSCKESK